jgi:RNA polymerase sigma-70 factor (ECF subfamily)
MADPPSGADLTPERVFREYAPRVYHLARRMLGNESDAEDVTQEVFLQVVRKLNTFRGESSFPTWLHRVTVNAALAYRQKRAGREERRVPDPLELFDADGRHGAQVKRWSVRPEQTVLAKEQHRVIENAIAHLPEQFRHVYVLADVEQMPNAEIAGVLHLSVSAVKSRLHRARLMMREYLAPHFEETYA